MQRKESHIDWISLIFYFVLVGMGWLTIYIADVHADYTGYRNINQLKWIGVSTFVAFFILIVDRRLITTLSYPFYGLIMLSLLSVLFFGTEINGAKAWFQFGSFKIQPAEFAKFATCLALAKYMGGVGFSFSKTKDLFLSGMILGIPLSLIVLQNDVGSALVYASFLIAFYREGLSPIPYILGIVVLMLTIFTIKWSAFYIILILIFFSILLFLILIKNTKQVIFLTILALGGYIFGYTKTLDYFDLTNMHWASAATLAGYVLLFIFHLLSSFKAIYLRSFFVICFFVFSVGFSLSVSYLFENLLRSHQKERILQVIGEAEESYNVVQAKIAISLGGATGQGFLKGMYTKLEYVPEQETDFIFTVVGETFGFMGTSIVVCTFLFFMYRLLVLAERQRSRFSRVYGYGVFGIFFCHFTINVGMAIGLLPVIGIPLPFFSYGGSSLLAFTILLFIFLKLDRSRQERVT